MITLANSQANYLSVR